MFCFQIGLNSSNYLWIVTQSVVGNINDKMAGRDQSWSPDFRGISFAMENFKDPSKTDRMFCGYFENVNTYYCFGFLDLGGLIDTGLYPYLIDKEYLLPSKCS